MKKQKNAIELKKQKIGTELQKHSNITFGKVIFSALIMFFLVCMIVSPAKYIQQGLNGITAWAFNVLPSVLPFMFFTRALSALDVMPTLTRPFAPLSKTLFGTPPVSVYAFCMAILSGYPVGSKMVADLYLQGKISRTDAFRMSAFCSTSGPMFIVGAVGIGMFHSARLGYILLLSHIIGAVANGILFRNLHAKTEIFPQNTRATETLSQNTKASKISTENCAEKEIAKTKLEEKEITEEVSQKEKTQNEKAQIKIAESQVEQKEVVEKEMAQNEIAQKEKAFNLADIVTNSTLSILCVGCIIAIFFIIIECFSPLLSLFPQNIQFFLQGIIEITKGCLSLSTLQNIPLAATLCSFVISFGGISTILQSLTMLSTVKLPVKLFVLQKLCHALFSTLATIILLAVVY